MHDAGKGSKGNWRRDPETAALDGDLPGQAEPLKLESMQ